MFLTGFFFGRAVHSAQKSRVMLQHPHVLEGCSTTTSIHVWFSCFQKAAIAKLMMILHVSKKSFLILPIADYTQPDQSESNSQNGWRRAWDRVPSPKRDRELRVRDERDTCSAHRSYIYCAHGVRPPRSSTAFCSVKPPVLQSGKKSLLTSRKKNAINAERINKKRPKLHSHVVL